MFYCPNCNNLYSISKNIPTVILNGGRDSLNDSISETPDTISTTKTPSQSNSNDISKKDISKRAYFLCSNCGNHEEIPPGTNIVRKSVDTLYQMTDNIEKNKLYVEQKFYPRTRNYICPNDKCISNKDDSKREAIFFRIGNTYKVKYICTACYNSF
jgi:predicted RNA-binding Zn-ribbon protein involved in translation (DUF1610 family)